MRKWLPSALRALMGMAAVWAGAGDLLAQAKVPGSGTAVAPAKVAGAPNTTAPNAGFGTAPKAGPVETLPVSQVKKGMQAVAWTVFEGSTPEAVPIEIIGVWKNAWGPREDIILGKMGGKAARTNVAGGMSGSPVYVDGKLIGAVALRLSVFSPDAICGITPIDLMLEINKMDQSRPSDAKAPQTLPKRAQLELPGEMLQQVLAASQAGGASGGGSAVTSAPYLTPIETPLTLSGFHSEVFTQFGPMFRQMNLQPVQGGATAALRGAKPVAGYAKALQPGESIAGVLVSGDMSMTGLGTVTYNDGRQVLGFGHSFFNLGPVNMPMAKGEVLMVLSSAYQPNKFANASDVVGALRQDRHSGIMGVLGEESKMIPVAVKVRNYAEDGKVRKEKTLHFDVFVQEKWTPYLMMVTLYNSVAGTNDFAEETTYRLKANIALQDGKKLEVETIKAPTDAPVPPSMQLAGWWGDKFNRLFLNPVSMPEMKSVDVTVDLVPARQTLTIESAWIPESEVLPGTEIPVKAYLRPHRGERIEAELRLRVPEGLPEGNYRIQLSDADTLNRTQAFAASASRYLDLPETISLINQERSNNRLYATLLQQRPTAYVEDKTLPNLPSSVMNVMQNGRSSSRALVALPETAVGEASLAFQSLVSGSYSLRVRVK